MTSNLRKEMMHQIVVSFQLDVYIIETDEFFSPLFMVNIMSWSILHAWLKDFRVRYQYRTVDVTFLILPSLILYLVFISGSIFCDS